MSWIKKYSTELWESLPAWFILYISLFITFSDLAYLPAQRFDYALLFILPVVAFIVYHAARFRSVSDRGNSGPLLRTVVLSFIIFCVFALVLAVTPPVRLGVGPRHFDRVVLFFETANILWALLLGFHCYRFRGIPGAALFFGVAFMYGMVLESGGVTMGYFYEDYYHLYIPGFSAPAATMFGWSTVFYPSVFIIEGMRKGFSFIDRRSFIWHAVFTAIIACLIDAHIDPFASAFGLWKWNSIYTGGSGLYWFGVPLVNYISWFSAVVSFGLFYFYFESRREWAGMRKVKALALSLPLILITATVIEFSSLAAIEGIDGPSWRILKGYIASGMPLMRKPKRGMRPEADH